MYQIKDSTAFKPFGDRKKKGNRQQEAKQQKIGRYLYSKYKGENKLGVPDGTGRLKFGMPDFGKVDSVDGCARSTGNAVP